MERTLFERQFPQELKTMSNRDLGLLCAEIREFLLDKVSVTGGHLASNLGVVELSVALHKVFDSPNDKIIWDVGHQAYVHKILTGRAAGFDTLRQKNGLSGFPKRGESEHDFYDSGHASTSISAAMGYAVARDLKGETHQVIAVIGDGSLTGGVAFEALNNAGNRGTSMKVILNDNEMSIEGSSGSLSKYLSTLRTSQNYLKFKKGLKTALKGKKVGDGLYHGLENLRDSVKSAVLDGALFEELGFKYFGPVDGHNLEELLEALEMTKNIEGPVLVHVVTRKGKGYRNAENNPEKYHGIGTFDPSTGMVNGSTATTYSKVFGNKMLQLATKDDRVVAVTAAMMEATGLLRFQQRYPDRTFDVGIAEQHAVSFAAGLALAGMKPVVAIYSTFLQRSYDEILSEVCLQNLPVIFAIDRGGVVGNDGETHHGVFDLSYLSHMPNMTVLLPKDGAELADMLEYAMTLDGPCAIRYPRGIAEDLSAYGRLPMDGTLEVLKEGKQPVLVAGGKMTGIALEAAKLLEYMGRTPGVVNLRFLKPLDKNGLLAAVKDAEAVVTLEDNVCTGGLGSAVSAALEEEGLHLPVLRIGWPDRFIPQGNQNELFDDFGLSPRKIAERIGEFLERKA